MEWGLEFSEKYLCIVRVFSRFQDEPVRTYQGLSITLVASTFSLSFIAGSGALHLSSNNL